MNQDSLQQYVSEYMREFARIHNEEIYKWRAVKHFQDSWKPDAEDFAEMLSMSLSKTNNLMDSGNYFPRRMILENAHKTPQAVREAFLDLFDEDKELLGRISSFQTRIGELNARHKPGKKDYQDHRAVMVYLNLRYPDNYFFYKFKMFKTFSEKTEHSYVPRRGRLSNIIQYLDLCENVREEILPNNKLLKLHKDRIGENEYFDASFNILTQDFIYAVTKYLTVDKSVPTEIGPKLIIRNIHPGPLKKKEKDFQFVGRYTDFVSQQQRNKRMGDKGEDLVLAHEKAHCAPKQRDKIVHTSKTEGDGLGFDISSFDEVGNKKFIEVKTTGGGERTPFFLSRTELERSKKEGVRYFLYRLYNYDDENKTADCFILQGDLSEYCINPTQYEVLLQVDQSEPLGQI